MEQEKDFLQIMMFGLSKVIKNLPFGEKVSDKLEEKALERESKKLEKKAEKLEKRATKTEYKIALIEKNKALKEKNEALKEKIDKLKNTAEELKKDIKVIKENENSKESMREKYSERFGIDLKALKEEIKAEILQETSKEKEISKEKEVIKEKLKNEIKKEISKEDNQGLSKKGEVNYFDLKNTGAELSYAMVSKSELAQIKEKLSIEFSCFATENKDKINLAIKKDDFGKVNDLLNELRKDITEEVLSHIGDGKILGEIDGMNKEDGFKIYSKLKNLESKGLVQFSGNPDNLSKQKVKVTENGKKLLNQIEKYKENNKGKSPSKITISKMVKGINGMDKGNVSKGVGNGR